MVRYNWIEGGNRQLDLVDAEDSEVLQQDSRYHQTFVYGNVLIEPDAAGNRQIIHYGGDSGNTAAYRKGTLYLHHNTIVSTRAGRTTLLRLSTNDEAADCRNNIIFVTDSGNQLELLSDAGALSLNRNWLKAGWVDSFNGNASGTITGAATSIIGATPGFIDPSQQYFRLSVDSDCLDVGFNLHPVTELDHAPVREYRRHQRNDRRRMLSDVADLGAFEFSPFAVWRNERFAGDAQNELVSGKDADPDKDGLTNLAEFAFDLNPLAGASDGLPSSVLLEVEQQWYAAVEFRRRPPPSGLVYRTRVTADFQTWLPGCVYSDSAPTLSTAYTTDASSGDWTRVRLISPLSVAPTGFIAVDVQFE